MVHEETIALSATSKVSCWMQCSQQLAKISTSFTVCDDEQVSQIMCSETFTALCPNVLREFSKKRYRVKVVAAEYPAFPSSALMFVEYFLAGQKIKPSGSLKKKKKNLAKLDAPVGKPL